MNNLNNPILLLFRHLVITRQTEPTTENVSSNIHSRAFYIGICAPSAITLNRNERVGPIWKPMHMQPIYRTNPFVTVEGNGRGRTNAYIKGSGVDVGADIFRRGLCLPSDNKMTPEHQDVIIDIIHRCFR